MSGFLSRKYLQYRGLLVSSPQPRFIDEDLYCTACGYNLRGLNYGRNCPECGQITGRRPAGSSTDPLLRGDESERRVISMGLLVGAICLVTATVARLLLLTGLVLGIGVTSVTHYLVLGFVLSALWWAACVLMIRGRPQGGPRWNILAHLAAWSQGLWLLGYTLLAMRVNATGGGAGNEMFLHVANLLVRGLAGVGALGVAYFMMRAAEDAELEIAARRLNTVLWVLPIVTVLTALAPPAMPWTFAILLFLVLLPWVWFMCLWARSLWEMHRHIAWMARLAAEYAGREQRIAELKRELQEQAESIIRPIGRETPVIFGDHDYFCRRCRYNLRGLRKSAVCPECGTPIVTAE